MRKISLVLLLSCCGCMLMCTPPPQGPGALTGVVKFTGKKPKLVELDLSAEPTCAALHKEPVYSEELVLGKGDTLAHVFIKIADEGVPEGDYPIPEEPFVLTQKGCRYTPHVFAMRLGQKLKILNPDSMLHNLHGRPNNNKEFNASMPPFMAETEVSFDKTETTPYSIKCDAHLWMQAYHAIMPHPFFDVTDENGTFLIDQLPSGNYKLMAWHEKFGYQEQQVTVEAGRTVAVNFTFSSKK